MKISDEWLSVPSTSGSGALVILTVRDDIEKFIASRKYIFRVEVTWEYNGDDDGMPSFEDSSLMEKATDALNNCFNADPVAIMTGIYTGDNERNWVFYTRNLRIFQRKFNDALSQLPEMPLKFDVEEDPDWNEYRLLSGD